MSSSVRHLSRSDPHLTLNLYRRLRRDGSPIDAHTFPPVFSACGRLGDLDEGRRAHLHATHLGHDSDVFVRNSLVDMYSRCGLLDFARHLFDEMPQRTVVTWTTILSAYARAGLPGKLPGLLREMLREGFSPNRATFVGTMPGIRTRRFAEAIYAFAVTSGWGDDLPVCNAALAMFARSGRIDASRRIFNRIDDKDLISWTSMIDAYAAADNMATEALEIFRKMRSPSPSSEIVKPDHVTVLSLIRACAGSGSIRIARFVHGIVVKSDFRSNMMVESTLLDLYAKCGSLKMARTLFDHMKDKNVVSWSAMIFGYGMHGRGKDALDLFHRMMRSSVKPDHITLVAVLSACSHSGLVEEGWRYFESMQEELGIVPQCTHYACMVDLLGRAGKLQEALRFIERMPIMPDASVWGSLLGACRIHLNVEMAEVAAKHLFELDPENSGRYVLLSNIYAYSGKRDDADCARDLMKKRGVRQITAQSFIEVGNKRYGFIVGDRSHPQTDLIYDELERLMARIKREGYVPNTNLVLLDVEEEAKEGLLYVHSEKLAIVFGLLNLGPDRDILIHKKLRICTDCHEACKFISKVTERTIVIRDSHRFHHFKGGECSCGDYW